MKTSKGGYSVVSLINLLAALINSGSFCRFFISDHTSDLRFIRIIKLYMDNQILKIIGARIWLSEFVNGTQKEAAR